MPSEPLVNVPNALSASRVPLAVALFACVVHEAWLAGLIIFVVATATDWLDGWWARKYGPLTLVGRNLDPLADKILVCGAFIYLMSERTGILPWMVTVVVCRELLVTGLRGMVEATGKKFGADWFGKLKMALQCAVIIGVLLIQWGRASAFPSGVMGVLEPVQAVLLIQWGRASAFPTGVMGVLEPVQAVLLWAMLAATVGSGAQYVVKAVRLLR